MNVKKHLPLVITGTLLVIAIVLLSLANRQGADNVADCSQVDITTADTVFVEVTDAGFVPAEAAVQQCDSVFITNESEENVYLAFGTHDNHHDYHGFAEQDLAPDDFVEIRLAQYGDFTLHNHYREEDIFSLTVERDDELNQMTQDKLYDDNHSHSPAY